MKRNILGQSQRKAAFARRKDIRESNSQRRFSRGRGEKKALQARDRMPTKKKPSRGGRGLEAEDENLRRNQAGEGPADMEKKPKSPKKKNISTASREKNPKKSSQGGDRPIQKIGGKKNA